MLDRPAAGEIVTETLDYDGGRQVTVYIPSGPPEAVVFAGDGQLISQWGAVLEPASCRTVRRYFSIGAGQIMISAPAHSFWP